MNNVVQDFPRLVPGLKININVSDSRVLQIVKSLLTFPWRRALSYRNQPIDLQSKSTDWVLYEKDFRHERVKVLMWLKIGAPIKDADT